MNTKEEIQSNDCIDLGDAVVETRGSDLDGAYDSVQFQFYKNGGIDQED